MKKFIIALIIFSAPVFVYFALNYFLVNNIAYRPWEAVSFYQSIPYLGNFYPDSEVDMISVGDLCHHSKNAVQKEEYWKIDNLGFRNYKFIEEPDILFIGDSFFAGSGITQENTIDNSVKRVLDNKVDVYNMAPSTMSKFDFFLKNGIIHKPKLIVFSISERHNVDDLYFADLNSDHEGLVIKIQNSKRVVITDKLKRFYLFRYLLARAVGKTGSGVAGEKNMNMYFFKGKKVTEKNMKETLKDAENIISYKNYCDTLGVDFLFIPMPNKESVYFDFVPLEKQSAYIFQLDSILKKANVQTINSLEIYNKYRKTSTDLLYQIDDSHWNSNAIKLISDEIAERFSTRIISKE